MDEMSLAIGTHYVLTACIQATMPAWWDITVWNMCKATGARIQTPDLTTQRQTRSAKDRYTAQEMHKRHVCTLWWEKRKHGAASGLLCLCCYCSISLRYDWLSCINEVQKANCSEYVRHEAGSRGIGWNGICALSALRRSRFLPLFTFFTSVWSCYY